MRKIISLILLVSLIVLSCNAKIAMADNAEDLLNIYGLTLGGPIKSELQEEMEAIEGVINQIESTQGRNDEYYAMLAVYLQKRETLLSQSISAIQTYQSRNEDIVYEFNESLLTADIDFLLSFDSEYKSNEQYISSLLDNVNKISSNEMKIDGIEYDTSSWENKLSDVKTLYIESLDAYNLGDVKNIKWITDTDRNILYGYGYRIEPTNNKNIRFHSGVDYSCNVGTSVYALFNGTVISSGYTMSLGNYVSIQSGDNIKYLISHLSKVYVKDGEYVTQYSKIGLSGKTGSTIKEPCVHVSLFINGVTYDVNKLFEH